MWDAQRTNQTYVIEHSEQFKILLDFPGMLFELFHMDLNQFKMWI